MREAIEAGLQVLANNYAQDGEKLIGLFGSRELEWHFIGHIQSRKVKYLTRYHCVQSIDRLPVATALNERLDVEKGNLRILIEVNIGNEPQKSGVSLDSLDAFLRELSHFSHLKLSGLMGMPPPLEPVEERRPFFRKLRELYDRYRQMYPFDCLSMGTSEDYLVAAEEGATMVRLGTALFGERPSKSPS